MIPSSITVYGECKGASAPQRLRISALTHQLASALPCLRYHTSTSSLLHVIASMFLSDFTLTFCVVHLVCNSLFFIFSNESQGARRQEGGNSRTGTCQRVAWFGYRLFGHNDSTAKKPNQQNGKHSANSKCREKKKDKSKGNHHTCT